MSSIDASCNTHPRIRLWLTLLDNVRLLLGSLIFVGGAAIVIKLAHPMGWLCMMIALTMFLRVLRGATDTRHHARNRALHIVEIGGLLAAGAGLLYYAGIF